MPLDNFPNYRYLKLHVMITIIKAEALGHHFTLPEEWLLWGGLVTPSRESYKTSG